MVKLIIAALLALLWAQNGIARGYETTEQILQDCARPVEAKPSAQLLEFLQAGGNTLASLPTIDCVAVLFGDSRDETRAYAIAADAGHYITRRIKAGTDRARYRFAQTPFAFADKPRGEGQWQIIRWEFDTPEIKIDDDTPLKMRRIRPKPKGALQDQTVSIERRFKIERQGETVDELWLLVDDWGPWRRHLDAPRERKWHVYSTRTNVTVLRSLLTPLRSKPSKISWHSTDLAQLVYVKDGKVDLRITEEELAPLRTFLKDFDVWAGHRN
ncbi:MAG: hypothetical protein ABW092_07410 [Candidatus Thiodiazotropha sp.]